MAVLSKDNRFPREEEWRRGVGGEDKPWQAGYLN